MHHNNLNCNKNNLIFWYKEVTFKVYFQVDQKYYLFFYLQKSMDIHFLYQSLDVIQELDSKQRKI